MPYQITLTNGASLVTIADNTLDHTTSLTLVGENYSGFGTYHNDNFVRLLENAANTNPPSAPLNGQLWYSTNSNPSLNALKVYNSGLAAWITVSGAVVSVAGNTGTVTLAQLVTSGLAPLASPALTGTPTAPTASNGTNTTQLATTAFVLNELATISTGVVSVIGNTGAVTLSQLVTGGVAPLASPTFTGTTAAPTPTAGDNTTKIATTAFVTTATTVSALTTVGMAPLASPALTGVPTVPTAASNTNTTQAASTAFVNSQIAASAVNNPNMLINPALLVQQMNNLGVTISGSNLNNVYLNDGWALSCSGVPSMTGQCVNITDGSRATIGNEAAQFAFSIGTSGTPGVNDYALFSQRIEDNYLFAGKHVVVSFWGYTSINNAKICIEFEQNFGSGGTPNTTVTGTGQVAGTFTLNTTWTYYTTSAILIPSVSGKTFGTNVNSDFLEMRIWLTAGSTIGASTANNIGSQSFTLTMWNPTLQIGTVASPVLPRPHAIEKSVCQRYYESSFWSIQNYTNGNQIGHSIPFKTTKRTAPGITMDSSLGSTNLASSGLSTNTITADAFQVQMFPASSGIISVAGNWHADARL